MKTVLKAFCVLAVAGAVASPVRAGDAAPTEAKDSKDLKKVIEDQGINYVETAQKGITLSGYVDTSYTEQFAGAGEYAPATGIAGQNPGGGPPNQHGGAVAPNYYSFDPSSSIRSFDQSNNTFNI